MIRKLFIEDLKPGMKVVKMSSDVWEHLPYLYTTPGIIATQDEIQHIREQGFHYAYIELPPPGERTLDERIQTVLNSSTPPRQKKRMPFDSTIELAQRAFESAIGQARRIIHDAKLGRKMDYEASVQVVGDVVDVAIRNPDTLLCLSKLSTHDDYTYTHCINVSAIAIIFGESLGLDRDELTKLGIAGMMHDLGKTAISSRIINKQTRLTDEEFRTMQRHPQYGSEILARQGDVPQDILDAVLDHHEKFDGSGYPAGKDNKNTSPMARIISMADVYDALTSDRSYKNAILPNKALAIMYGMGEQNFDPLEVQMFIKCLGIFPSGSLVKLNTGFYGVVYESNPDRPLLPKIKIILDQDLRPIPSELVDLAAKQAVGSEHLEILECADPASYRLNLKPFLTRKS